MEKSCGILWKQIENADVAQWQSARFPSQIRGFDSRHLLQKTLVLLNECFFIHCESNGISSTIALLSLYLISP